MNNIGLSLPLSAAQQLTQLQALGSLPELSAGREAFSDAIALQQQLSYVDALSGLDIGLSPEIAQEADIFGGLSVEYSQGEELALSSIQTLEETIEAIQSGFVLKDDGDATGLSDAEAQLLSNKAFVNALALLQAFAPQENSGGNQIALEQAIFSGLSV